MLISELANSVNNFYANNMKQKCRILGILPKDNIWEVTCEVTVDTAYTSIRGMGDVVEIYEVQIDDKKEILGFTLKETKRKAALDRE